MKVTERSKRASARYLAGISAILHHDGQAYKCEAANLSRSGVLLTGELPHLSGEKVRATLASAAGDLHVEIVCVVAHVREQPEGRAVGLQFRGMTDDDKKNLERLISRVVEGSAPAPIMQLKPGARPNEIREALQKMPVVHRMTLAARAMAKERGYLLEDNNPQVLEALARNPNINLTEIKLLARNQLLLPTTLEIMAKDPRWKRDEEFQIILATHPQAGFKLAEGIVTKLSELGVQKVLQSPNLHPDLRFQLADPITRKRLRR